MIPIMHFSVLVPCHDPDPVLLDEALTSITSQLDVRLHQVIVLDGASTDPAVCATAAARHRVTLVRGDVDVGGCRDHNAAYALAEGDLVHVCHPDDRVLPGFHDVVRDVARREPGRALYAAHSVVADGDGRAVATPRPRWLEGERGFLPLHHGNPLCVPGCVLAGEFVRYWTSQMGGVWDERLIHTADWECWIRATCFRGSCGVQGACSIDWPLAVWRSHEANHSHRLMRSAANLRDYLTLAGIVREYAPELVDDRLFRLYVAARARQQEEHYRRRGELYAASANEQLAVELGA